MKLLFGGVSAHAIEKDAYFDPPSTKISAENWWLGLVLYFTCPEGFLASAEREFTAAHCSEVADPLGLAAWRDQVQTAIDA